MIEVGEYFRTKDGYIGKITRLFGEDPCFRNINYYRTDILYTMPSCYSSYNIYEDMIIKHSKNIIDLIEVGDIVEMYDVLNEDVIYIWNEEMLKAVKEDVANGIKIRRILTKEQYEANCYKVKEEL